MKFYLIYKRYLYNAISLWLFTYQGGVFTATLFIIIVCHNFYYDWCFLVLVL